MGENDGDTSKELVKLLDFVKADLEESEADFEDEYIRHIQEKIRSIKGSRKMEEQFMILEEMLRDERAEGKAEGKAEAILELLEELGTIPEAVQNRIMNESDMEVLKKWHKLSARVNTLEEFLKKM